MRWWVPIAMFAVAFLNYSSLIRHIEWEREGGGERGGKVRSMGNMQKCNLQSFLMRMRAYPAVVLSMWPCKFISHLQVLIYLLFFNPTHETKIGIANRWEMTNSDPPRRPIKLSSQSTAGVHLCCAIHQPQHTLQKCRAKTQSAEPNWHVLMFLQQIFICRVIYELVESL
jgi:hypothetical protein